MQSPSPTTVKLMPLWLALMLSQGCGDDDPVKMSDGIVNATPNESGEVSPPTDAGMDGGPIEVLLSDECSVDAPSELPLPDTRTMPSPFAFHGARNDLSLLNLSDACEADDVENRALTFHGFRSSEEPGSGSSVMGANEAVCQRLAAPSLLSFFDPAAGEDVTHAFYMRSVTAGGWELVSQRVAGAESGTGAPEALLRSENDTAWPPGEVDAARVNERVLISWTESAPTAGQQFSQASGRLWVRQRISDGAGRELVPESEGQHPESIAISALGTEDSDKALIAWVNRLGEPAIYAQALTGQGVPSGERITLTNLVGSATSISLVANEEGAAAVYTVVSSFGMPEIRFQAFDLQGQPMGLERSIAGGVEQARDGTITATRKGYLVAYRLVAEGATPEPLLRLAYLDTLGNLARKRDVLTLSGSGSMVHAYEANDGRVLLAWADQEADRSTLRVMRATCL